MSEDYEPELERFLLDESFHQWVLRPTPELDARWAQYRAGHPDQAASLDRARQLVRALHARTMDISEEEIEAEVSRILQRTHPRVRPLPVRWWAAAAVLAGLALGGWWLWGTQNAPTPGTTQTAGVPEAGAFTEHTNDGAQPETVRLPDGSRVTLQPGSTLRYPAALAGAERAVELSGDAFFDVTRQPQRPFRVLTDALVTRVLGTSFWVKTASRRRASVEVRTGRVSVARRDAAQTELILTPNQQATFDGNDLARTLVTQPTLLEVPARNPSFVFENTPIAEVFGTLERAYGIPIDFDADRMRTCALTAPLGDEPLFSKLDIICKTLGARYEIRDARIRIESAGCPP